MSKTYAIADLHGRFDLLEMALACLAKRAEPPATLVTLGDYVDRGPDSRKIIERLMAGLERDGWRLICLKGNHEDIMWQTCRRSPDVDWWLTNGGGRRFTRLPCRTDLQPLRFLSAPCEAAILEDEVRDHYFAATWKPHRRTEAVAA